MGLIVTFSCFAWPFLNRTTWQNQEEKWRVKIEKEGRKRGRKEEIVAGWMYEWPVGRLAAWMDGWMATET